MTHRYSPMLLVIVTVLAALVTGCAGSPPARYYLLSPLPQDKDDVPGSDRPAIVVGPVRLPSHLERPQIATRTGKNELHLAEFDRWAEPLEENLARVVAEGLSSLVGSGNVAVFPWRGGTADYQVTVDVTRFEGTLDGTATIGGRWTVLTGDGRKALVTRRFVFEERVTTEDYASLVAAYSRCLASLTKEIAADLLRIPSPNPAP
jgi:uncharacterized protein